MVEILSLSAFVACGRMSQRACITHRWLLGTLQHQPLPREEHGCDAIGGFAGASRGTTRKESGFAVVGWITTTKYGATPMFRQIPIPCLTECSQCGSAVFSCAIYYEIHFLDRKQSFVPLKGLFKYPFGSPASRHPDAICPCGQLLLGSDKSFVKEILQGHFVADLVWEGCRLDRSRSDRQKRFF